MAESRVIIPTKQDSEGIIDYDYIAFSFRDKHSLEDFGIYRTSDGNRYNEELLPSSQDTTAEVPNGDGAYYFNTRHKQKVFNISFAFQDLGEKKLRELKQWLNSKESGDLWFAENPYKVYTAKVTGQPTIKYVPFDVHNSAGNIIGRTYSGEGSVQFTCYWPYAHTPDFVYKKNGGTLSKVGDGKVLNSYDGFANVNGWAAASGLKRLNNPNSTTELQGAICVGENPGDVPAHFTVTTTSTVGAGTTLQVGDAKIKILKQCNGLTWDSKTGMVSTLSSGVATAIDFIGDSCGTIPAGVQTVIKQLPANAKLTYHYWYY